MKISWKMVLAYASVSMGLLLFVIFGSRAVTALSENGDVQHRYCIVIDPGHGGEDGGAVSHSGSPESSYNLEISLKLNDLLSLLGYHTKMTRNSDVSVYTKGETLSQKKISDLKERVKTVNETDGAVLLSIHQNHFPDDRYSGAQVFYAKTDGSQALANKLQSEILKTVNPGSIRQAKISSGIYLMDHIHCPGVLIECGFLSNPDEDRNLKDPKYQKKLCCVIAAATCQYLSNT